jgi:hypothetical protein
MIDFIGLILVKKKEMAPVNKGKQIVIGETSE